MANTKITLHVNHTKKCELRTVMTRIMVESFTSPDLRYQQMSMLRSASAALQSSLGSNTTIHLGLAVLTNIDVNGLDF